MDVNRSSSSSGAMQTVGFFYDEGMLAHKLLDGVFDEVPKRVELSFEYLASKSILERCLRVPVKKVDRDQLAFVHEKRYTDNIKNWATDSKAKQRQTEKSISEVYMSPGTYDAALLAAGAVFQASHLVLNGTLDSAFALVRPPGHHASHCQARGFCLFNNIAIAAQSLVIEKWTRKVLIVDWDVHFGDGTQAAFEENSQVLYFSLHRYNNCTYYPENEKADFKSVGEGGGRHFTVNVPFNYVTCGDADYAAVWQEVLMPLVKEFKPEIILISGGFDAGDVPTSGCW